MNNIRRKQRVINKVYGILLGSLILSTVITNVTKNEDKTIIELKEKIDLNYIKLNELDSLNLLKDSVINDINTRVYALVTINQALIEKEDDWNDTLTYLNLIKYGNN